MLDISTPPSSTYSASDKEDLASAATYSVNAAVQLMSTQSFSEAILWLLDLADPTIQLRALELLRTKLPTIKPARRPDVSPAVLAVVERLRDVLVKTPTDAEAALETLDVIVSSIHQDEDAALAKTVPELMAVARATAGSDKSACALSLNILKKLM